MTELDPQLEQLAARHGVATDYWDWQGRHVLVPAETLIAVLGALGVPAASPDERDDAFRTHERAHWARSLPPVIVARTGQPTAFWVHLTHGDPVEAWIELERGGMRTGLSQLENGTQPFDLDGRFIGEASFEVPPDIALGYHQLAIRAGDYVTRTLLIVTPSWLGFPERMGDRREWGLATQLYSVRSCASWGVGDLADLTDLAVWAGAEHGAGFVLVNPMHAAEPITPMEPSPYLPTSRRFANPIYLRPERICEYAEVAHREAIVKFRTDLQEAIEGLDAIDRDAAWVAKRAALEQIYAVPRSDGRNFAYAAYRRREGRGLDDFAAWCVLVEEHGRDWHHWPAELQHPTSPAVTDFAAANEAQVDFHRWLQWQLDEQLSATQSAATRAGMALGVVHDLAVGVHPNGADAWALQEMLATGITVGAPPDAFNQTGQNWTQPPWRPDQLAELAYAPFRALVSAVLRNAGGVRIDHIIGLFRLWWIPEGAPPTEGTYVRYDHEALIGIVALEAYRSRAVVVGEDLGVVEPWVRAYLEQRGILGTSILWFEFDYPAGGAPLPAERWREYCLSSVTTHDLPPTAGYLAGDHVRLRESLGLLTRPLEEELVADRSERGAWLAELQRRGLLPDSTDLTASPDDVTATVIALHRYLTQTPSRLLSLSLTDAVGDRRTQNQPGTVDEYPNWRVPLTGPDGRPMLLEEVFASPRVKALAETIRPPAGQ